MTTEKTEFTQEELTTLITLLANKITYLKDTKIPHDRQSALLVKLTTMLTQIVE